ncbi:MAG: VapB-type antitoxin [Thermoproteota archaeon]|jgi:DNA-binding transcriptional regulator YhcF (GntR family)|nr:VapB-type antitoxin [Thermoproteota archaeon]
MIGKILVRKADDKGRILISEFREKEVYLVNLGSGYFVTDNKNVAEKVAENASKAFDEEFLKLVEELGITAEEAKKILEKETLKEAL